VNLKRLIAASAIAAAFGIAALGLGRVRRMPSGLHRSRQEQRGLKTTTGGGATGTVHGHGHPGWRPGWGWYGPGVSACVSATGPWGYVIGSASI
jgi:hypothetical protein